MPFQIIRNDITKVKADAIVNTANPEPKYAAGTDGAIYKATGADKLWSERKKIGRIKFGDVAVTPAYKLKAKYIIHTVAPAWNGGNKGEFEVLKSCYSRSLTKAAELGCESIAFPLIATGVYMFPKKGLKAELGSDRLLGVPLETYIASEKLAIESGSADENIEIMKAYMCKQRGIRLIKLPMKGTELDYADSLKRAFQNVHIFISSDTEEDVEIIKNTFERWRDSQ